MRSHLSAAENNRRRLAGRRRGADTSGIGTDTDRCDAAGFPGSAVTAARRDAVLSCCHVACCRVAVLPCCRVAVLPCCRVAVLPCCRVAVLPCCRVAVLPCCREAVRP
ncbi:hypothetical protein EGY28_28805 [Burkholderia dolosa]|nr:hypothetical protein EGY28_28805 [Burkholderia dolosa]